MKRLHLFIGVIMAVLLSSCHASREATQEDIRNNQVAQEMIANQAFTVKAQRLSIKHHSFPSISPTTNFILVDGDKAIVQVSPGTSGGPNGVGGFTVNGMITSYEAKAKDNGEVNLRYHVQAIAGSCDVTVKLIKESNEAIVNITSTFRGGSATMYGKLTPIDDSVYVGRTKY